MNANVFRLFLYIYEHVYFADAGRRQTEDIKNSKPFLNYSSMIKTAGKTHTKNSSGVGTTQDADHSRRSKSFIYDFIQVSK